ncbi:MAG: polysaccharide deacetylase family protein [Candidatus Marinimicrobia bacterium]|nr:polysaccharide deacetylase family protein [Candidatus Neomarinimicrobiota bacterium]
MLSKICFFCKKEDAKLSARSKYVFKDFIFIAESIDIEQKDKKIMPIIKRIFLLFILLIALNNCDSLLNNDISEPKGGVCLTFDDVYVNEWYKLSNLLKLSDFNATFFISKIHSLSSSEIHNLRKLDSLGFEIGCHGWNHINAVDYLTHYSLAEYYNVEILPALNFMNKNNLSPTSFTYPRGMHNDSLDQYLLQKFQVLRCVTLEQVKPLTVNVEDISEIFIKKNKSQIVAGLGIDKQFKISEDMLYNALERASENDEILILYAHCPVDSNAQHYQINKSYIENLILKCEELNLKSYRISEI